MEEILKRRSIRCYLEKDIPEEDIKKILKAGMNAPSAHNLKPYDIIVVKNKETLKKLSQTGLYSHMVEYANVAIIICSKADETCPYWQADCGAVVENMLLEATHLKIGSCWIGEYPNLEKANKTKEILQIPASYQVFATISLGYAVKEKEKNDNYYEEKVHYEKF